MPCISLSGQCPLSDFIALYLHSTLVNKMDTFEKLYFNLLISSFTFHLHGDKKTKNKNKRKQNYIIINNADDYLRLLSQYLWKIWIETSTKMYTSF